MRILIAPDKFKGSLGAREVADQIAAGLREVSPNAEIEIVPVADGGEGTAEAICRACTGEWVTCRAHDALGREIQARYVRLGSSAKAVMEMSEAAGGGRVSPSERDPLQASTFGVGEMMLDAARCGAREIIIGLGGSVTNDGGFGMARALQFKFCDDQNVELVGPVSDLLRLDRIETSASLNQARVVALADVRNPLLGENGATRIFGPQKGATPEKQEILENALSRLADVASRSLDVDHRNSEGAGAAGGLGFGLMSFCGATIRPGFEVVSEMLDLEAAVRRADVIITGEGRLDEQTLVGKAPAGVAMLGRKWGKRVFAIVGSAVESSGTRALFERVLPLAKPPVTREEAIAQAADLLKERGRELGAFLGSVGGAVDPA